MFVIMLGLVCRWIMVGMQIWNMNRIYLLKNANAREAVITSNNSLVNRLKRRHNPNTSKPRRSGIDAHIFIFVGMIENSVMVKFLGVLDQSLCKFLSADVQPGLPFAYVSNVRLLQVGGGKPYAS